MAHIHVFINTVQPVTDVLLPTLDSAEQPPHASAKGFDEVPHVERVADGRKTHDSAGRRVSFVFDRRDRLILVWDGIKCSGCASSVGCIGESPEVKDGEHGHFDAKQQCWDADLEIGIG